MDPEQRDARGAALRRQGVSASTGRPPTTCSATATRPAPPAGSRRSRRGGARARPWCRPGARRRLARRLSDARASEAPTSPPRSGRSCGAGHAARRFRSTSPAAGKSGRRSAAGGRRGGVHLLRQPGIPARPLRDTASGGELSRAMLAISGMVTLGTRSGRSSSTKSTPASGGHRRRLGERLARLAERRQIICITHLPQVVAFADRQFAIIKHSDPAAASTQTEVRQVEGDERLAELCRMLGAARRRRRGRSHAESLLAGPTLCG